MVFFDFNVPYLESLGGSNRQQPLPDSNARKNARLKIAVKAMELGYSGIAYNRTLKGVMSDTDKCAISLFPLSSLLKLAPSIDTAVKFHRELLGVPLNSPFRQYSRLTVVVDSLVQIAALNSGNPVLKSYDLVAVRPMNQTLFDHACKSSEVDLIAIDFSLKLPFRLKLPMVKAAIERGVYFEITYAPFISDVQTRRQVVANAKLLVNWTRGKNLIFSSAAASVNEIRGPNDVANLSSLLGLSMEHAKAAISKNCRSLITSALRKKQFYKETIKVERISHDEQKDSEDPWFVDAHSWDPISSGEGDILLDDIAKLCCTVSKPKTSSAIDFSSISQEMQSDAMQLNDWLSGGRKKLSMDDTSSLLSEVKGSKGTENESRLLKNEISMVLENSNDIRKPKVSSEGLTSSNNVVCASSVASLHDTLSQDPIITSKRIPFSGGATMQPTCSTHVVSISVETPSLDKPSHNPMATLEQNNFLGDFNLESHFIPNDKPSQNPRAVLERNHFSGHVNVEPNFMPKETEDSVKSNHHDVVVGTNDDRMEIITSVPEERNQVGGDHMSVDSHSPSCNLNMMQSNDSVQVADERMLSLSNDETQEHATWLAYDVQSEGAFSLLKAQKQETSVGVNMSRKEAKSGNARFKQRNHLQALPFPFKSLLKPAVFKKKSQNWKKR